MRACEFTSTALNLTENKKLFSQLINDILQTVPNAIEIWFHGSRARGTNRKNSDWDIQVIVPDDVRGGPYIDVNIALQELEKHYPNFDIQPGHIGDLVNRIAREEGQLLWSITNENFADGKIKGKSRPGRVKRSGASCDGSVGDLRARAKRYGGERGKMYHWCANMKSGRNK